MEESADWRLRYDEAVERASKCTKELIEIKKSLKKVEDAAGINKKLEMLQKIWSCFFLWRQRRRLYHCLFRKEEQYDSLHHQHWWICFFLGLKSESWK
ncbi:uncharacterized protein LOC130760495 isoform X4 [Actinidia eriantha]|uniref:uncharacterized protein LOC130760495 isoform X4 n=1 Tax=Actinidia eriantha TaxID=165200 RepID=UPI00258DA09F|nr:uncharacterized protein LOC130760495 isoform X4 [Actinidia eriantha]